jgi:hypothetical protein
MLIGGQAQAGGPYSIIHDAISRTGAIDCHLLSTDELIELLDLRTHY